jgi:predicted ATPase
LKLQRLHIKNFKSIVDLEIIEPNPFTVFVGPNGSGKSNIFEALEWRFFSPNSTSSIPKREDIYPNVFRFGITPNEKNNWGVPDVELYFTAFDVLGFSLHRIRAIHENEAGIPFPFEKQSEYKQFIDGFSNIFIENVKREKISLSSDRKLSTSASNLEKVLKRILKDEGKREDILEILQLLVPELENIEVYSDNISGQDTLLIKEKNTNKPFGKSLISDGTYNILCLLTAVYQSDEPQFLCIEEPENGLSPYAIELLVELMRNKCEEKGHYIWLNTHSPTLVRQLRADELILVDKKEGATQITQFKGENFHGLSMDEAWLTNALGGGLPW